MLIKPIYITSCFTKKGSQRDENQDKIIKINKNNFWSVVDGMGGHDFGGFASAYISNYFEAYMNNRNEVTLFDIQEQFNIINNDFYFKATSLSINIIGASIACIFIQDDYLNILWAGDTRVYLVRDRSLYLMTDDHKIYLDNNKKSEYLTNAVGLGIDFFLEKKQINVKIGDTYLICSDGFYKRISQQKINQFMSNSPIPYTNYNDPFSKIVFPDDCSYIIVSIR